MSARKRLSEVRRKMQSIIAPGLKYSQYLYEDALTPYVRPGLTWLDLGCGHKMLVPWHWEEEKQLVGRCRIVVGADYSLESLKQHRTIIHKVRGDASTLPFKDGSFDLITANMVVEHLDDPEVQFREVYRILKLGGLFIFHTPNESGYMTMIAKSIPEAWKKKLALILEGREEKNVFPTHYKANSESRIKKLAGATGFDVRKIKMIVTNPEFSIIPPVVMLELLWIRMLMTKPLRKWRTNIIAILEKEKPKSN